MSLSVEAFAVGNEQGLFDGIIDVRTQAEWRLGHVANATFVENLASTGSLEVVAGCEYCRLVVYCQSGGRARIAIQRLKMAGFKGELYNAHGTKQWIAAGHGLVTTSSAPLPCSERKADVCLQAPKPPIVSKTRTNRTNSPNKLPTAPIKIQGEMSSASVAETEYVVYFAIIAVIAVSLCRFWTCAKSYWRKYAIEKRTFLRDRL